jgi:hypothetical protein
MVRMHMQPRQDVLRTCGYSLMQAASILMSMCGTNKQRRVMLKPLKPGFMSGVNPE